MGHWYRDWLAHFHEKGWFPADMTPAGQPIKKSFLKSGTKEEWARKFWEFLRRSTGDHNNVWASLVPSGERFGGFGASRVYTAESGGPPVVARGPAATFLGHSAVIVEEASDKNHKVGSKNDHSFPWQQFRISSSSCVSCILPSSCQHMYNT